MVRDGAQAAMRLALEDGDLAPEDVAYVNAPAEGEAQCAHMARHDQEVDYAGSDDYDTLLFGAPFTLRQLTSKGDPELMDFAATLETHDLTWEQLVDAAILMGTDFNEGITGVGECSGWPRVS